MQDKGNLEIPSVAEDDQEFLMKHRETLDKEDVKDREKNKSGFLASLQKIGGQTAVRRLFMLSMMTLRSGDASHGSPNWNESVSPCDSNQHTHHL